MAGPVQIKNGAGAIGNEGDRFMNRMQGMVGKRKTGKKSKSAEQALKDGDTNNKDSTCEGDDVKSLHSSNHSNGSSAGSTMSGLYSIAEQESLPPTARLTCPENMKEVLLWGNKKLLKTLAKASKDNGKKVQVQLAVRQDFQDLVVRYMGQLYIPHMMVGTQELVMIGLPDPEDDVNNTATPTATKASFFTFPSSALAHMKPYGSLVGYIVIGIKHGKVQCLAWNDDIATDEREAEQMLESKTALEVIADAQQSRMDPFSKSFAKDNQCFKMILTHQQ